MSLDHWKSRALRAEDRVRQLEAQIRLLEGAKAVAAESPVKKVVKKVTKKAGSKKAATA